MLVPEAPPPPQAKVAQRSQERRARRIARYTAVQELRAQGLSLRAIATQLHLSRKTVRQFAVAAQFPERATRQTRRSKLAPFIPYLEQHLAVGQDNAMQLWRDLRDHHCYTGSRALVSRWVAQHRQLVPAMDATSASARRRGRPPGTVPTLPPAPQRRLSARQAAWLLVRRPAELTADDQHLVERLCQQAPSVDVAYRLTQEFITIVREHQSEAFAGWLLRATASGIPELQSFVVGLERDQAVVVAALSLPFSNGQVEGQVNRLKLIKRMAYGRAKFDLLRLRVLVRAA